MFNKKKDKLTGRLFYVHFLGWLPCKRVQGSDQTIPVISELKSRVKEHSSLPKLTLKLSNNDIEVSPISDESKKKSKPRVFTIVLQDIMFVSLERSNSDIAACIFRNRNMQNPNYLQVHVYRFDSSTTSLHFVQNLQMMTNTPIHLQHILRIDEFLRKEELQKSFSSEGSSSSAPDDLASNIQEVVVIENPKIESITDELNRKFQLKETPLLLPPKDYDTVRRKQGHLDKMGTRKCRNENIIGSLGHYFDDDNDDDDDDSQTQPPIPLYPAKKSPSSPPISCVRNPGSPALVRSRDGSGNGYQRPNSGYDDSQTQPPLSLYPAKKSPSSPPISHVKNPRSPALVRSRDGSGNGYLRPKPEFDHPNQQPPYSLYPATKSPVRPSRKSLEMKNPEYQLRDNVYQKPNSYGGAVDKSINSSVKSKPISPQSPESFNKKSVMKTSSQKSLASSGRSDSSNHSDSVKNFLPTSPKPKPSIEIPPDYDQSPQNIKYVLQATQPPSGYYRDDMRFYPANMGYQNRTGQIAQRPYSSNMDLHQMRTEAPFDFSKLHAIPNKRNFGEKKNKR